MQNKKHLAKKIISVADAVTMNAVSEYWLSLKHAGLHIISSLALTRIFVAHDILINNLIINPHHD